MKRLFTIALCALLAFSLLGITALAGLYIEDPNTTNTFAANDDDGNIPYNFKGGGGAWVNIMNPWGKSAFMVMEPSSGFVQSMIITFMVQGYDGGADGYRMMVGFGINGFSPSIWSLDADGEDGGNWENIYGEKFDFYIDADGIYTIIADFRGAMDWFESENDWYIKEYLEGIDCIELGIFSPPEDTTMLITILDLEETDEIFTLAQISRPRGSNVHFEPLPPDAVLPGPVVPPVETTPDPTPEPAPEATPAPTPAPAPAPESPSSEPERGGLDTWVWIVIGVGAVGIIATVVIVVVKKKK